MMQWAIRDYIKAFRWENIKEQFKYGTGYLSLYILILLPVYGSYFDAKGKLLELYLLTIPVSYALFSTMLYPMALPKLMYLCPMDRERRKEYLTKASVVRMIAPILIGLPGIIWVVIYNSFDWLCGLGVFLNISFLCLVLGRGNNAIGYEKKKHTEDKTMGIDTILGIRQFLLFIITLLMNAIYLISIGTKDPCWMKVILIGVTLLTSLPIAISCMKEWPKAIEAALSYESSGGAWRQRESK